MDVMSIASDIPVAVQSPPPAVSAETTENNVKPQSTPVQAVKDDRPAEPVSAEVVEKIIAQVNKAISSYGREMHVRVHEKTKRIMVKVMDTQEKKVIREIPPEKVLDAFARTLELAGILMDKSR